MTSVSMNSSENGALFRAPGVALVRPTSHATRKASSSDGSLSPMDMNEYLRKENELLTEKFFEPPNPSRIPYTPSIDNTNSVSFKPGGYPCHECGDRYANRTSLAIHLGRRSALAHVFCRCCHQQLKFYNRCAAASHCRSHATASSGITVTDVRACFGDVTVETIDWQTFSQWFEDEPFRRLTNPDEFMAYELALANCQRDDTTTSATTFSAEQNEEASSLKCEECDTPFAERSALTQHFAYDLPQNQKQFICPSCHAVYFSRCGIQAHNRCCHAAPSFKSPFVCPECGEVTKSNDEWTLHLATHRNRPAALLSWRCIKCFTFYSSWDALTAHVASSHFISSVIEGAEKLIKCCFCHSVLTKSKDAVTSHIRTHSGVLNSFKVFRCALCGRLMESKSGLCSHFRTVHRMYVAADAIQEDNIIQPLSEATLTGESDHIAATAMDTLNCDLCPQFIFASRSDFEAHKKIHESNVQRWKSPKSAAQTKNSHSQQDGDNNFKCLRCKTAFPTSQLRLLHGKTHLVKGELVCLLCKNLPIHSAAVLERHFVKHLDERPKTGRDSGVFVCERHCRRSFSDATKAFNHMKELHNLK